MSSKTTFAQWVDAVVDCAALVEIDRRRDNLADLERFEAEELERDPRRPGVFAPGDKVTFCAQYLQLAYSCVVPESARRVFTVRACHCDLCKAGEFVSTTDWLEDYGIFGHLRKGVLAHHGAVHGETLCVAPLISIPRAGNTRYVRPGDP